MKNWLFILFLVVWGLLFSGCEKLVIPDLEKNGTEQKGNDNSEDSSGEDDEGKDVEDESGKEGDDDGKKDGNDGGKDDETGNEDDGNDDSGDEGNKGEGGDEGDDVSGGGDDTSDDDDGNFAGDGTEEFPFHVSDLLKGNMRYLVVEEGMEIPDCWVAGYVVGYIDGNKISEKNVVFGNEGDVVTNIIIAESPDCKNYEECFPVQLSTGSSYAATRKALNLADNPEILGKPVIVFGLVKKYMGVPGLKNTRKYSIIE